MGLTQSENQPLMLNRQVKIILFQFLPDNNDYKSAKYFDYDQLLIQQTDILFSLPVPAQIYRQLFYQKF
jgi:hypothetical protein